MDRGNNVVGYEAQYNGRDFQPRRPLDHDTHEEAEAYRIANDHTMYYEESDSDHVHNNWELVTMLLEAFGKNPKMGNQFLDSVVDK